VESEFLFFSHCRSEETDGRYEAEIARLRRELEARGGGGVAEPPEGSKPAEYERSMYPPALGAPPSNGDSRMSPPLKHIQKAKISPIAIPTTRTPNR
jgi:hypothetical protein